MKTVTIPSLPDRIAIDFDQLKVQAQQLGFAQVSVANFDGLPKAKQALDAWLADGMHGGMDFLARNAHIRSAQV